jgi:hypothetical protein
MVGHFDKELDPSEYSVGNLDSEMKIIRFYRRILLRVARWGRSAKGKRRLYMLILAEYIVSLVVVTLAAIFFWALLISISASESVPLADALSLSTEGFFPPIGGTESTPDIPFWARIGPSATSFLLFVLYIGLASSLVRDRQRLASRELANTCNTLRTHAAMLRQSSEMRAGLREGLAQRELPAGAPRGEQPSQDE